MRLLYVTDALAIFGGLERVLTQKVNWLVDHGYDVCVLTANQGNHPFCFSLHPQVRFEDLGIIFYRQYSFSMWRRLYVRRELNRKFRQGLRDIIRDFSPDIIICVKLEFVRNIIRVKGNIPFIFESHSSCLCGIFGRDSFPRKLNMWYLKLSLDKADAVVALTNGDAKEWRRYSSNVCVIPNVVLLNQSQISDCSAKSVIFVGRFTQQKDVNSLLQIWSIVHHRNPDWILHVYGGYGPEQNELMAKINEISANIMVHDPSPEMITKYKESSILLFTSLYEPFGLVLPEAMSCGLPVVAFDCPYGPADIVNDGVDGFLIANRSIEEYVEKVCFLIENEKLRIDMGKAGISSSQRFNECIIMPQWKKLFEELIAFN